MDELLQFDPWRSSSGGLHLEEAMQLHGTAMEQVFVTKGGLAAPTP